MDAAMASSRNTITTDDSSILSIEKSENIPATSAEAISTTKRDDINTPDTHFSVGFLKFSESFTDLPPGIEIVDLTDSDKFIDTAEINGDILRSMYDRIYLVSHENKKIALVALCKHQESSVLVYLWRDARMAGNETHFCAYMYKVGRKLYNVENFAVDIDDKDTELHDYAVFVCPYALTDGRSKPYMGKSFVPTNVPKFVSSKNGPFTTIKGDGYEVKFYTVRYSSKFFKDHNVSVYCSLLGTETLIAAYILNISGKTRTALSAVIKYTKCQMIRCFTKIHETMIDGGSRQVYDCVGTMEGYTPKIYL